MNHCIENNSCTAYIRSTEKGQALRIFRGAFFLCLQNFPQEYYKCEIIFLVKYIDKTKFIW